jgi:hypothetical protein
MDLALILRKIFEPYVAWCDFPTPNTFNAPTLVFIDSVTTILVPLDNILWSKSGFVKSYGKTSSSRK